LTRVITELEKIRLDKREDLRRAASRLSKVKEEEITKARKELEAANDKYEAAKSLTSYLDGSILFGAVATGFCVVGILETFSSSEVTFILKFCYITAIMVFFLESLCLLGIVFVYVRITRAKIVEELETKRIAEEFSVPRPFSKHGKKKRKG